MSDSLVFTIRIVGLEINDAKDVKNKKPDQFIDYNLTSLLDLNENRF